MKKKLGLLMLVGLLMVLLVACGPGSGDGNIVEIDIEGYGVITIVLYPEYAPITVDNFINLINDGFYDGLTFHRIIEDFMIQGGCNFGTGMGGSDDMIVGEFSSNGIYNPISHVRGVISMARAMDPNSGSSQFFIMHQDGTFLDGEYAAFGRVTDGMEVVDEIVATIVNDGPNGSVAPGDQPVINSIRVVN